jgi:hypothetical protein
LKGGNSVGEIEKHRDFLDYVFKECRTRGIGLMYNVSVTVNTALTAEPTFVLAGVNDSPAMIQQCTFILKHAGKEHQMK